MKNKQTNDGVLTVESEVKTPVVFPYVVEKQEKKIVCPVCGHVNAENTALCKMCSNYLQGE